MLGAAAWRRAVWMQLAEWEVTAKDGQAGFTEGGRQCHEKRRFAVCSRTMGEDEGIAGRTCWNVKEAANGGVSGVISEREYRRLAH